MDLAWRPQLLLAEPAEELSQDLMFQPGGPGELTVILRDKPALLLLAPPLLPPLPPLSVLLPPLLLLTDALRLLARNPLGAARPSLSPPLVSLQSFLLQSVLSLLALCSLPHFPPPVLSQLHPDPL